MSRGIWRQWIALQWKSDCGKCPLRQDYACTRTPFPGFRGSAQTLRRRFSQTCGWTRRSLQAAHFSPVE